MGGGLIISSDTFVESVHFDLKYFSPVDLGYKSLSAAFSDIAAEGGKPLYYLLNLGLTEKNSLQDFRAIMEGMEIVNDRYSVELIGGDTFRAPVVFISITVVGKAEKPVTRKGAREGDCLYVTGSLGGAQMGLYALKNKIESKITKYHLRPEIRCNEGIYLKRNYHLSSMIDVSDGLLIDSNHLAEEGGVRIDIESGSIPVCEECREFASRHSLELMEMVLTSGEEFELLFTSPDDVKEKWVTRIGRITSGSGVWVDGEKTPPRGFTHFREK